jgi:ribosomal protein L22
MVTVVLTLIPVVVGYLVALLRKKTAEINANINNAEVTKYTNILESTVENVVHTIAETFTKEIKAKGAFDTATANEAFDMAMKNTLNVIGENGLTILKEVYGDVDELIRNLIEKNVAKMKK